MKSTRPKTLHLVVEGAPASARALVPPPSDEAEVLILSEASAAEALKKIFAARAVAVWGDVKVESDHPGL